MISSLCNYKMTFWHSTNLNQNLKRSRNRRMRLNLKPRPNQNQMPKPRPNRKPNRNQRSNLRPNLRPNQNLSQKQKLRRNQVSDQRMPLRTLPKANFTPWIAPTWSLEWLTEIPPGSGIIIPGIARLRGETHPGVVLMISQARRPCPAYICVL